MHTFIRWGIVLTCGLGFAFRAGDSDAASETKPNVVLYLVDDMGWLDSGVYGSEYYETPNIDRFAERGLRFTRAYAHPLCSPSRASILTGKYNTRHGILTASGHRPPQPPGHDFMPAKGAPNRPTIGPESKNYLDPDEHTLAEALREAGYRTAHIGKWHVGLTQDYWPDKQGYDVTFHCAPDPGPPSYFSPYGVSAEGVPAGRTHVGNVTDGPEGEYIVDRQADEAIRFMRANQARPFFLSFACYGVHGPWGHKPEYTAEFAKKKDPRGVQANPIMASMMRSVDEAFGRVLDELDRLGLTGNTIVIFYSDNGGNTHSNIPGTGKTEAAERHKSEFLADWRKWAGDLPPTNNWPLRSGKGSLHEGGVRVPMIWAWKGRIPEGAVTDALAGNIDLYPTLLDLLGLAKREGQIIDGVSLAPILRGTGTIERDLFIYFPYQRDGVDITVHSGDFKLLRSFVPGAPLQLYNLKEDIGETKNLADSMPDKAADLSARIDAFLKETDALVPRPNPDYKPAPPRAGGPADPAQGLVPKSCSIAVVEGVLRVTAEGKNPFLGTAQAKAPGPLTLTLRARSAPGGAGRIAWSTADQEDFSDDRSTGFQIAGGSEWQEVTVNLPIRGATKVLRLHLPAEAAPVDIESITVRSGKTGNAVKSWSFRPPAR